MNLSSLHPPAGSRHKRKRVGRGPGSGLGKTSGRGEKGQKSRSGYSRKRGFEGGQMPLVRRVPKRGFHNIFRREFAVINVSSIEKLEGDVTPQGLLDAGVISNLRGGLKILGDGELKRAVKVSAHRVSKSAREKIEAAGGSVELLEPAPEPKKKPAAPPPPPAAKAEKPKKSKGGEEGGDAGAKAEKPAKPRAAKEASGDQPAKGKSGKAKPEGDAKNKKS
jgi:large subunit ribosomal protein L15